MRSCDPIPAENSRSNSTDQKKGNFIQETTATEEKRSLVIRKQRQSCKISS